MNDTNNDDIAIFPITTLGLRFHNTVDRLRFLTTGPEFGLSQGVQKVRSIAQISGKKAGGMYHPPSVHSHRIRVMFYAQCASIWKDNYVIQTNSQSSNLTKHIAAFTVT